MKTRLITFAIPILVLLSVWLPEIAHYHVETASLSNQEIETLRHAPSDSSLQELTTLSLGLDFGLTDDQFIHLASTILEGKLSLPGYEPFSIQLPFDSSDLGQGLLTWQLIFSSMAAPEILINAYRLTHDERYFDLARDMILAWAHYEKKQWLPLTRFLWNDHAIAARITVLTKFWRFYRMRDDFKPEDARLILQFVLRSGEMLAKKEHFTAATNHGIMQNVALLHIAAVFPVLPQAEKFQRIAYERLQDQLAFYINDEGVVLEHSAGYHELGMMLIENILHYAALNGFTVPKDWIEKYEKGKRFLDNIKRPDGTLPQFGNTLGQSVYFGSSFPSLINRESKKLYPVSGYSVWWQEYRQALSIYPFSQTVIAWSHFPGHGHKLADEMSVLIWADGQNWITNTGYWPYGVFGREHVDSWEGSNAPHLVGEPENSTRKTALLSYLAEDKLAFSQLRRTGPDGYSAERQVIHSGENLWIIIDYTADRHPRKTTTTWTFASDLNVINGNWPGQFLVNKPAFSCMTASFINSEETIPDRYAGSKDPFAGWVVTNKNQPKAAQSVVIENSSNGTWSAAVFSLEKSCQENEMDQPQMMQWNSPDSWNLSLKHSGKEITFERQNHTISVTDTENGFTEYTVQSIDVESIAQAQNRITDTFNRVAEKYPRYNPDLFFYRTKISYLLLAVMLTQFLFFFLYAKMKLPYKKPLQVLINVFWILLGSYLSFIYFKT